MDNGLDGLEDDGVRHGNSLGRSGQEIVRA